MPARYNRNLVAVTNPSATTGGTREEFPEVTQQDVDAAIATLDEDAARGQFQADLDDPATLPAGTTVFPETAVLGEADARRGPRRRSSSRRSRRSRWRCPARGDRPAVDASPIEAIAAPAARGRDRRGLGARATAARRSTSARGRVVGRRRRRSRSTAARSRSSRSTRRALEREVLGLSQADAEAALAEYGEVAIVLWPG